MDKKERKKNKLTGRGLFLLRMAVGAVIGLGGILPGVSGGILAVSLGLYVPMIDAIAGFFKAPRKNFLFLAPIGLGACLGFLLGAVALAGLMGRWYNQIVWLFVGLVAGGIPGLVREANERGFKKRWLLAALLGAGLASLLLLLERGAADGADIARLSPLQAVISGAVVSVGAVVPGVSTSFILMYLGWYRAMMDAFAALDVLTLLFLALGAGGCFLLTVKLARLVFDRFHGWAYYAVLGFLPVSAVLILPEITTGPALLADAALALLGALGAYFMSALDV